MVKHIVMFKFADEVSEEVRERAVADFKAGIEALPAVIPSIREVAVGVNINAAEKWDVCLESTFDSLDDVRAYGAYAAHKAVAQEFMKYVGVRACVDFEK